MPQLVVTGSRADKVDIEGIPQAYILRNDALEALLFDRNLIGLEFARTCEDASASFLRHFEPELQTVFSDIAELMPLTKGLYYWLHHAFARVFDRNLEINFVGMNRQEVKGDEASVVISYTNFDAPARHLIIGDTIASGSTICTALSKYMETWPLDRVFIFSIAGSLVGGRAIASFCAERNVDLHIAYGLGVFGLAPNGFDLSFMHPDTITHADYRERAREVFRGRRVSSVGWDFGSQSQSLRKYSMLCWVEAAYWELQDDEVFKFQTQPNNRKLIEKEFPAYAGRFSSIDELLVDEAR